MLNKFYSIQFTFFSKQTTLCKHRLFIPCVYETLTTKGHQNQITHQQTISLASYFIAQFIRIDVDRRFRFKLATQTQLNIAYYIER